MCWVRAKYATDGGLYGKTGWGARCNALSFEMPTIPMYGIIVNEQSTRVKRMSGNGDLKKTSEQDAVEALRRRLGKLEPQQIAAWRGMSPARRLELAFQAYQFALDVVRLTERQRHPDLPAQELAWRVTRRMQGDARLGR